MSLHQPVTGYDTSYASIQAKEHFENTFPFQPHFVPVSGCQLHYVEEGPQEATETLLFLHGEPTWSYLYRNIIPVLSDRHRVIALDHMGFGKSETPQQCPHTLQAHIDNLEAFVLAQGLDQITLVMHDFGGPVGTGLALRHPDRIKRLIAVNAPLPLGLPSQADRISQNIAASPWFQWILKAYATGTLETTLGDLHYNILSTLKLNGFERHDMISPVWLQAYATPFATPQACLGAIGWARGVADGTLAFEAANSETVAKLRAKPATAIWGMKDPTLRAEYLLPLFQEAFPDAPVSRLEHAGHYSPEDAPETIALLIQQFVHLT